MQRAKYNSYPKSNKLLGSKSSIGMTNSVSHSSYNSANEVTLTRKNLIIQDLNSGARV